MFQLLQVNYGLDHNSPEKTPYQKVYLERRAGGTSVKVTDLKEDTSYEFQVAAKTRHGVGLAAVMPVVTKSKRKYMYI